VTNSIFKGAAHEFHLYFITLDNNVDPFISDSFFSYIMYTSSSNSRNGHHQPIKIKPGTQIIRNRTHHPTGNMQLFNKKHFFQSHFQLKLVFSLASQLRIRIHIKILKKIELKHINSQAQMCLINNI